jgi:hypothetical protein
MSLAINSKCQDILKNSKLHFTAVDTKGRRSIRATCSIESETYTHRCYVKKRTYKTMPTRDTGIFILSLIYLAEYYGTCQSLYKLFIKCKGYIILVPLTNVEYEDLHPLIKKYKELGTSMLLIDGFMLILTVPHVAKCTSKEEVLEQREAEYKSGNFEKCANDNIMVGLIKLDPFLKPGEYLTTQNSILGLKISLEKLQGRIPAEENAYLKYVMNFVTQKLLLLDFDIPDRTMTGPDRTSFFKKCKS